MDTATLKLVATRILEECPGELVSIYALLADKAESAVRSGHSIDIHQVAAEKIRQPRCSERHHLEGGPCAATWVLYGGKQAGRQNRGDFAMDHGADADCSTTALSLQPPTRIARTGSSLPQLRHVTPLEVV